MEEKLGRRHARVKGIGNKTFCDGKTGSTRKVRQTSIDKAVWNTTSIDRLDRSDNSKNTRSGLSKYNADQTNKLYQPILHLSNTS